MDPGREVMHDDLSFEGTTGEFKLRARGVVFEYNKVLRSLAPILSVSAIR